MPGPGPAMSQGQIVALLMAAAGVALLRARACPGGASPTGDV